MAALGLGGVEVLGRGQIPGLGRVVDVGLIWIGATGIAGRLVVFVGHFAALGSLISRAKHGVLHTSESHESTAVEVVVSELRELRERWIEYQSAIAKGPPLSASKGAVSGYRYDPLHFGPF